MNDIRTFIKRNIGIPNYKLAIKYNYANNEVVYRYQLHNHHLITLLFTETNDSIILNHDNRDISNIYEIYIILYNLADYTHNIDYIDAYIMKSNATITDIYNDYYDDYNKQLISHRNINSQTLKFITQIDNDKHITLYYNLETITDFDDILKKIDLIINQ